MHQHHKLLSVILMGFTLVLSGCFEKKDTPSETTSTASTESTVSASSAMLPPDTKAEIELKLGSDGDNIAFDKTTLQVKAGAIVKVTFKNNVKTSGMEHNWILAKPGTESDIAAQSIQAGQDKGWLASNHSGIIAHTKLIKAGEEDSVVFKAPPAGEYPYICSFPGHGMAMKGVLKSQ